MANGNHAINLIKIAIRVLIGPMGPIRPISPILLFFSPGISAPTNRTASKSLVTVHGPGFDLSENLKI